MSCGLWSISEKLKAAERILLFCVVWNSSYYGMHYKPKKYDYVTLWMCQFDFEIVKSSKVFCFTHRSSNFWCWLEPNNITPHTPQKNTILILCQINCKQVFFKKKKEKKTGKKSLVNRTLYSIIILVYKSNWSFS